MMFSSSETAKMSTT